MPKSLRFKKDDRDHKKHKRHRHHHHHRERSSREKPYRAPTLYEHEDGWVPPESMNKRDEEAEWREKLFSAMADDEGQDPYYAQYTDESCGRYGVDSMTDEEYRRHIVSGMFQKQNAEAIAHEEARKEAKEQRRRERREAREKLKEEEAERERVHEAYRREEQLRQGRESRELYTQRWKRLELATAISREDVPWPVLGSFSLKGVRDFLVDPNQPTSENKKAVRKEQLRYHPDKFVQRVLSKLEGSSEEHKRLCAKTNEISGWLNELWAEVCT